MHFLLDTSPAKRKSSGILWRASECSGNSFWCSCNSFRSTRVSSLFGGSQHSQVYRRFDFYAARARASGRDNLRRDNDIFGCGSRAEETHEHRENLPTRDAFMSDCRLTKWPSINGKLLWCKDGPPEVGLDADLHWLIRRVTKMQRFVLGKLSRMELLATLEAIRRIVMPSGGACGIACLWPLLSCVLASTNSQERQDLFLLPSLLHAADYRPGLFVEIGAYDGVNMSNTYMYERCFNWTGLLVEAQPDNFAALRQRSGRNATMVHSAVCSAGTDPPVVHMTRPRDGEGNIAKQVSDVGRNLTEAQTVAVPCAPLSRLMDTAGLGQADFFSLDVEGVRAACAREAIAH